MQCSQCCLPIGHCLKYKLILNQYTFLKFFWLHNLIIILQQLFVSLLYNVLSQCLSFCSYLHYFTWYAKNMYCFFFIIKQFCIFEKMAQFIGSDKKGWKCCICMEELCNSKTINGMHINSSHCPRFSHQEFSDILCLMILIFLVVQSKCIIFHCLIFVNKSCCRNLWLNSMTVTRSKYMPCNCSTYFRYVKWSIEMVKTECDLQWEMVTLTYNC